MTLELEARLNTTHVEAQEADWQGRLHRLNDDIGRTEQHLMTVTRKVMTAVSSTVNTVRSMLRAFGIALPPAWDAILGAITSTIMSLQAIAAAYTAGGVTAALAIPVEIAAIGLSIFSAAVAIAGQAEASRKMDEAETTMRSFGTTLTSWARVLGAWE